MGFLEKIQSRLELYRLEKRYTRSRLQRAGFVSNAMYVDGEYIYQTPNTTGSSTNSSSTSSTAYGGRCRSMPPAPEYAGQAQPSVPAKPVNRLSSIPGFNSLTSRHH
ncbi:hypothetical protein GGS21DRAFT_170948 [Xylaria nigripes]|nr:hypothetical protein GGS21DRAFT_170948 [Xylaria nigripes]